MQCLLKTENLRNYTFLSSRIASWRPFIR